MGPGYMGAGQNEPRLRLAEQIEAAFPGKKVVHVSHGYLLLPEDATFTAAPTLTRLWQKLTASRPQAES